jgi:hypothetical protein
MSEATAMDPQHRLILELVHEALNDAGGTLERRPPPTCLPAYSLANLGSARQCSHVHTHAHRTSIDNPPPNRTDSLKRSPTNQPNDPLTAHPSSTTYRLNHPLSRLLSYPYAHSHTRTLPHPRGTRHHWRRCQASHGGLRGHQLQRLSPAGRTDGRDKRVHGHRHSPRDRKRTHLVRHPFLIAL